MRKVGEFIVNKEGTPLRKEQFPAGFLWGTATAAYQIEGAINEGGRGPSVWDDFSHTPGKVAGGDTGDIACDHYHRFPEDIGIMNELGLNAYRASVSWSRVMPDGKGRVNQAGLDFYQRLVDSLLKAGITPLLTVFHWDLPSRLQELGGWANRDLVEYFRDYAGLLFETLGDRVPLWVTLNEPAVHITLGHIQGEHAPGLSDWKIAMQSAHHLLLAHGAAVEAFRNSRRPGAIGLTHVLNYYVPASAEPADQAAAARMDGLWNRWYLDAILRGEYPSDFWALLERHGLAPTVLPGDLERIRQPLDHLGINYYYREQIAADPNVKILEASPLRPNPPLTAMGWEIYPDGLYEALTRIKRDYGSLPLYITESGVAFNDRLEAGAVRDPERIAYLDRHFEQAARAIAAGVDLRGYFIWSLLDNFEWACGFSKRFGLVYVDYPTQARIIKESGRWLRDCLRK